MTAASEDPAVEVRGATFSYAGEPALSDVDFALPRGGMLALVGPNGGGKSTLLRGLLHLVDVSGEVRVLGTAPKQARRRCGYVPQVEAVDREFPISTLGVVLMGVGRRTGPPLWPRGRGKAAAREALGRVGLGGHERRPFRVLSGGQRQRVLVARALASRPEVLLLDEPFSGVDATSAEAIEAALRQVRERGTTVVVSTHDHDFAGRECSQAVLLNATQHACGACEDVLDPAALARCYTGRAAAAQGAQR